MSDIIKLDYFDWHKQFKPVKNFLNPSNEFAFETFGDDLKFIAYMQQHHPLRVWTQLEGDEDIIIVNGMHHVNRMCYCITEVPAIENVEYEVD